MNSSKAADADALLKAILRESTTEVLVFDADSLRISHANPAATHNLQYPLKALKQLTPPDCLAEADVQVFRSLLAVLQSGKKRRTTISAHCRRRDGSSYPVEAKLFRSVGQGRPIFIWIASDVSQREATRQALAHSAQDLRAIVAHIPGMAYQVLRKPDGSTSLRYVSAQSAQLLGIKPPALRADPGLGLPEKATAKDVRPRLKTAGKDRVCLKDKAAEDRCLMTFTRIGKTWKLAGIYAGDIKRVEPVME